MRLSRAYLLGAFLSAGVVAIGPRSTRQGYGSFRSLTSTRRFF